MKVSVVYIGGHTDQYQLHQGETVSYEDRYILLTMRTMDIRVPWTSINAVLEENS